MVATTSRFCVDDAPWPGTNNPVPIPSAGVNRSMWKTHAIYFSGQNTQVDNIRWYTDGTLGWNVGSPAGNVEVGYMSGAAAVASMHGFTMASYTRATGVVGTSGYSIKATQSRGHTQYQYNAYGVTGAFSFDTGSPLTVDTGVYTAETRSRAIALQLLVASNATQGTQTAETLYWKWDEI